jgi:IS605 OrfB family transposase
MDRDLRNYKPTLKASWKQKTMAKKGRKTKEAVVTRIAHSLPLRPAVLRELEEMARRLAPVRAAAWRRYGSLKGLHRSAEEIRDQDWMGEGGLASGLELPARVWKATLSDALSNIKANREAAKAAVKDNLWRRVFAGKMDRQACQDKINVLQQDDWLHDPLLHRLMRRHWRRGQSNCDNQIVLDCQCYCVVDTQEKVTWLQVSGLFPRKRVSIPLKGKHPISGTIRLILREAERIEVHYTVAESLAFEPRLCGDKEIGLDKGYSEVFTDNDGDRYGEGLGDLLTKESDRRKALYQSRQELASIAEKARQRGDEKKASRIEVNNLGTKKRDDHRFSHKCKVRTHIYTAVHQVFDKANSIVVEDLSRPITGYDRGSNTNRRLSAWVKGVEQKAVSTISRRRGASLDLVNAAYTSQVVPCCLSFGQRSGDRLYCTECGAVYDADKVAAGNVLDRKTDKEIGLYTPYQKVRSILQSRARQSQWKTCDTVETAQPGLQQGLSPPEKKPCLPFRSGGRCTRRA